MSIMAILAWEGAGSMSEAAERFLHLLSRREIALYQKIANENGTFYQIAGRRNTARREEQLSDYFDFMVRLLEEVRQTNSVVFILAVEYLLLVRDGQHLQLLAEQAGVDRFLKTDITGNQKGADEIDAALNALEFQSRNKELYHAIIRIGTPLRAFDSRNLPKDVVRDAVKTQAARLRLDIRGLNQTGLERKKSAFLGQRHLNMAASEDMYKSIQREAEKAL